LQFKGELQELLLHPKNWDGAEKKQIAMCSLCNHKTDAPVSNAGDSLRKHFIRVHLAYSSYVDLLSTGAVTYLKELEEKFNAAVNRSHAPTVSSSPSTNGPPNKKQKTLTGTRSIMSSFVVRTEPTTVVNEVRRACAIAVSLGHLPIDIASNMGIRFLLSNFSKKNCFPSGLSARSIGRELKDLYEEQVEAGKVKIGTALMRYESIFFSRLNVIDAGERAELKRVFNLQQDGWSRKTVKDHFLGSGVQFMNVSVKPWFVEHVSFGVNAFSGVPKSAVNARKVLEITAEKFGIDLLNQINSSTQDCTGSSYNVMKDVDGTFRTQCFAHRANTHLEQAFKKCKKLNQVLDAIEQIQIMIGSSNYRLEYLDEGYKAHCKSTNKVYIKKSFVKPATTRWNERQKVADRYLDDFRQVILAMDPVKLFPTGSKEEKRKSISAFKKHREAVEANRTLLESVLPYMRCTASWVQVLSAKGWFTMSLVLAAVREMTRCLDDMMSLAEKLRKDLDSEKVTAGNDLVIAVTVISEQREKYLGILFLNSSLALPASFLDPTTFPLMTRIEAESAERTIESMLSKIPSLSSVGARARGAPRALSIEEQAMIGDAARYFLSNEVVSSVDAKSRIATEFISYKSRFVALKKNWMVLKRKLEDEVDVNQKKTLELELKGVSESLLPENFWYDHTESLPCLAYLASRILSAPACSSDVERLFSVSGQICTQKRTSLSPLMVNILSSLHVWLRETEEYDTYKRLRREIRCRAYAQRTIDNATLKVVILKPNAENVDEVEKEEDDTIDADKLSSDLGTMDYRGDDDGSTAAERQPHLAELLAAIDVAVLADGEVEGIDSDVDSVAADLDVEDD